MYIITGVLLIDLISSHWKVSEKVDSRVQACLHHPAASKQMQDKGCVVTHTLYREPSQVENIEELLSTWDTVYVEYLYLRM